MAQIPTYDVPQERAGALPQPNVNSVASGELLGTGATQQAQFGRNLASAGNDLTDIAARMQSREDADMLFRAETGLRDNYIQYEQEAQKREGRLAKGITDDTRKWWDDSVKKASENLANERQRRMFVMKMASTRQSSLETMSHFEFAQLEKSHDESWAADKGSAISVAASTPTDQSVANATTELKRLNDYQAARKGWEPSRVDAENRKDLTDLHTQVIQQLAQTNPMYAASYFQRHKDEIDGTKHAELGKYSKEATATANGEAAAADIWAQKGPKQDTDPVELDKMEQAARDRFKDDEYSRKAAIAALKERAASHNSSQKEREAGNVNSVMDAVRQGAGVTTVRRMPEFNALSGETKNKIEEHIATRTNIMEARDLAEQTRLEREQLIKFSAAYHTYSDPNVLMNMSRAQVQALEPTIGRHYTDSLLSKWESIDKHEGALSEARIDNDAFKNIVRDFGFDPDKKLNLKNDKDAQQAARMGAMRDEVERQIGIEQKAKNRQLTRDEKDAVARRTLSKNVLRSTWFGLSSEEVPAASVIPADLKKVVVPPADREAIKRELVKRNKPANDEDIARWYLMGQRQRSPR